MGDSSIDDDAGTTIGALKDVPPWRTWPRHQPGSLFLENPATGTLVVDPDLDWKVRRALTREVRFIKFRLLQDRLDLKIEYLALKARCLLLRLRGVISHFFSKLVF